MLVAALRGGSGKTTITLGLIQALADRGLSVAPFKKGPDYIDPFWHTEAAGMACRNLDPYLMGKDQVTRSFAYHTQGAEAAVVEGNRGLFDGMDAMGSYSSAELAKWLGAPVLLVLDCSMASRTVAAVALGCQKYDPKLDMAGVILNQVATARQEKLIRRTVAEATGLPVLGAVPRLGLNMPERHMGLVPPQEHDQAARALHDAGRSVAQYVDLDGLWALMQGAPELPMNLDPPAGLLPGQEDSQEPVTVGVIRDAAFGFYYPENLEALANFGARLHFCSALEDKELPELDALFIGGGFPETHARRLAQNQGFRAALKAAAGAGLPIYAECGGLMYLGRHLVVDGESHDMVGVFPMDFVMQPKPQGHGYSHCTVDGPNPFWPQGLEFKAHEFHYSRPESVAGGSLAFAYQVNRGKGIIERKGGLVHKNTLGTFHHVHALGHAGWASGLLKAARAGRPG